MSCRIIRAAACGLLAAGCARPPSIVGTWSGTTTSARGITLQHTWTLAEDGKNTLAVHALNGPYSSVTVTASGTYTLSGGTLTQTLTSMSEGARTRAVASPKPVAYRVARNGDTLTVSGGSLPQPLVLTREQAP